MPDAEEINKWIDLFAGRNFAVVLVVAFLAGAWYFRKDLRSFLNAQEQQSKQSMESEKKIVDVSLKLAESTMGLNTAMEKLASSVATSTANHAITHDAITQHAKVDDANHKTTHSIVRQGVAEILEKVTALTEVASMNPQMANIKPELARIKTSAEQVEKKAG